MESEGREAYPGIASFITFIVWNVGGWFGGVGLKLAREYGEQNRSQKEKPNTP